MCETAIEGGRPVPGGFGGNRRRQGVHLTLETFEFYQTLNGCVICLNATFKEYIEKGHPHQGTRQRLTPGFAARWHIHRQRDSSAEKKTMSTSIAKVIGKDTQLEETLCEIQKQDFEEDEKTSSRVECQHFVLVVRSRQTCQQNKRSMLCNFIPRRFHVHPSSCADREKTSTIER